MPQSELRDKILKKFETWLDDILVQETPFPGVTQTIMEALANPPEPNAQSDGEHPDQSHVQDDLYSMWSAITVLTQEIKLQGRTFKKLSDQMEPLTGISEILEHLTALNERSYEDSNRMTIAAQNIRHTEENRIKVEAQERTRREMAQLLIDLRNRLLIGLDSAQESCDRLDQYRRSRWRYQLFKKKSAATRHMIEVVDSLKKGYQMSLAQIDDAMQELGVQEISCQGQLFDPQIMSVVEVEKNNEAMEGTVLELYQAGYLMNGEVLKPALVKVSTAAS